MREIKDPAPKKVLLVTARQGYLAPSSVAPLRNSLLVLLFVAWFPAANACTLAAVFPQTFTVCCEGDEGPGMPCESSCAGCVALENGFSLALLHPFLAPIPVRFEDAGLMRLFASLAAARVEQQAPAESTLSPPEPPLWQFVARTALPVRGPSLFV